MKVVVMEFVGRREQPRLLVVGLPDDGSDLAMTLRRLFPTIRFLDDPLRLSEVRQLDWDAAVLWGVGTNLAAHLYVLQFGGATTAGAFHAHWQIDIQLGPTAVSTEFGVPLGLPNDVESLVRDRLLPATVQAGASRTISITVGAPSVSATSRPKTAEVFEPFLVNGDLKAVAGRFRRHADLQTQWWWLPEDVPAPERWAAAALANWRIVDPERFARTARWRDRTEWQTAAEIEAVKSRQEVETRRDRTIAELDTELATVIAEAGVLSEAVDRTERRLLTAQGQNLVHEVMAALAEIGFEVHDVDSTIAKKGDLLEDLRVFDPDDPDWVSLAEIRGYKNGARMADLLRIPRFVMRYFKDENREPSAAWYVVNHFSGQDPSTRPLPLEANPAEVEAFGEDHAGLVIDTKDLFTLRERVRGGLETSAEARARFRSTGIFRI